MSGDGGGKFLHRMFSEVFTGEQVSVSKEEILRVSGLAHILIPDEDIERFQGDMALMISFVKSLQSVDCSKLNKTPEVCCPMRDDVVRADASVEDIFSNSKHKQDAHFVVPCAIEER